MLRAWFIRGLVSGTALLILPWHAFAQAPPKAPSAPQTGHESHWGIRASFVPQWELTDRIRKVIFDTNETGTFKGSEFGIGFVRGSSMGGDWGVSFVRKPWKDGSGSTSTDLICYDPAQTVCRPNTKSTLTRGVYLNAVEVHWFKRIVNIKRIAQIGFNVGGGIGAMKGNVHKINDSFQPTGFNNQGVPTGFQQVHEEKDLLAKDELLPYFPLLKVEALGSVSVTPALKVQVAGGLNFPAYSARIGFVYLIGAK